MVGTHSAFFPSAAASEPSAPPPKGPTAASRSLGLPACNSESGDSGMCRGLRKKEFAGARRRVNAQQMQAFIKQRGTRSQLSGPGAGVMRARLPASCSRSCPGALAKRLQTPA